MKHRAVATAMGPTVVAAALLLSGCTSAGPAATETAALVAQPGPTGALPNAAGAILVTPFSPFDPEWAASSKRTPPYPDARGGLFADAYTRLVITSETAPGGTLDGTAIDALPYNDRGPVARFFVGKEFAINLTALVSAGSFKATVPLLTLDHKSNSSIGEQWSRTIYHTAASFPLFLVSAGGQSSTPSLKVDLRGTVDYSSHLVASAVNAALTVAQDVSTESRVVTELSKASIQRQAQAVDAAIGKLLGIGIDEAHWYADEIRFWSWQKGATVSLYVPAGESSFDSAGKRPVGKWRVTFAEPRPSIFVDWRICPDGGSHGTWQAGGALDVYLRCAKDRPTAVNAVYRDVDNSAVLKTALADGDTTLGQIANYVAQQEWYKSAVVKLAALGAPIEAATTGAARQAAIAAQLTPSDTTAAELCRQVRDSMTGVGLSTVDAGIVVWAVATGMPNLPARDLILRNPTCQGWLGPINAQRS